jgi:hypothetical protein
MERESWKPQLEIGIRIMWHSMGYHFPDCAVISKNSKSWDAFAFELDSVLGWTNPLLPYLSAH